MIAIADGGCYLTFLSSTVLPSTFYGFTVLTTAVRFRQTGSGRQTGSRQAGGLKSGSSQAVRLKSGSVMMEALERTGRLSIGQFVYEGLGIR